MRSKGLGILLVLTVLPAWAQVPGAPVPPSTTDAVSPRQHGPRIALGLRPDRVVNGIPVWTSSNWSGYAVVGSSFTQAQGSWTVPTVDCTKNTNIASASFWVGIDGWDNGTVEQTGTDSDCSKDRPSYYAWYEFYPKGGVTITSVPVTPGDQISAEVVYNDPEFTVTLTNETTGKSYSTSSAVPGARRTSAEWIAEAPCCTNGGDTLPLSHFRVVPFGEDYTFLNDTNYATDASTSGQIGAFGNNVQEAIMVDGNNRVDAVPSPLSSDGTSFTVVRMPRARWP